MSKTHRGCHQGFGIKKDDIDDKMIERFWQKVNKRDQHDCWNWTAAVSKEGYGVIGKSKWMRELPDQYGKGSNFLAHRLSYALHYGEAPASLVVRHLCHNTRCVNPAHLLEGTQGDNRYDSSERLAKPQARRIRQLQVSGVPTTDIMRIVGLGRDLVQGVLDNKLCYDAAWDYDPKLNARVGSKTAAAKLSEADVKRYRRLWSHKILSVTEIAEETGLAFSTTSDMLNSITWTHVQAYPPPLNNDGTERAPICSKIKKARHGKRRSKCRNKA